MSKKTAVIIARMIPLVSAIASYILILGSYNAAWVSKVTGVTVLLALFGFVFFFIGRKHAGEDRALRILGILDILSTVSIIALYALAIASFGL